VTTTGEAVAAGRATGHETIPNWSRSEPMERKAATGRGRPEPVGCKAAVEGGCRPEVPAPG
jgi:hypothetical protein